MRLFVAVVLIMVCGTAISEAQVLRNGRLFYARVSVGYGAQSLGDVNSAIEDDIQFFQSGGVPVDWDTFNGDLDLGAEIGFRISEAVSLGAGINYQKNDLNNSYTDFSGAVADDIALTILDLTGNVTLWIPSARGLFFGASAGMGFGDFEEFYSFQIFGDPLSSFTINSNADGKRFTGGLFGGYEANFSSGVALFGKVGYRFRNLGEFDGSSRSPELGSGSGTLKNNAGQPIEFDFSGAYFVVGFGFSAGKTI